jgi:hypothetical protein
VGAGCQRRVQAHGDGPLGTRRGGECGRARGWARWPGPEAAQPRGGFLFSFFSFSISYFYFLFLFLLSPFLLNK